MSAVQGEGDRKRLFSEVPDQPNGPHFYRERRHFRSLLRKIVFPTEIVVAPVVLVICFQNIGAIIGRWIDSESSYVPEHLGAARSAFNQWFSQFSDLSWLLSFITGLWILLVVALYFKTYYDWTHAYYVISKEYVIESEKLLLQEESSRTIEASIVVGASVRRTLVDKLFPLCGSVVVQTIDLEGEGKKIQFLDVKDPYRMRDVILEVKRSIRS